MSYIDDMKEEALAPSDSEISRIAELASLQIELEGELDKAEQQVKDVKKRLHKISLDLLPEAMAEARLSEFKMLSGQKITVKEELSCSVPASRRGEIINKLRDDGEAALVSNVITVDVSKGQDNLAGDIMGYAESIGLLAKREESVNTASLKKLLREQLDEGENPDLAFYGAFQIKKAKINQ